MEHAKFLPRNGFQQLLDAVRATGRECHGPVSQDGAVMMAPLSRSEELPQGLHDLQAPGHYRLEPAGNGRWFAWANGPQALKPMLFEPHEPLWRVDLAGGSLQFTPTVPEPVPRAVFGVRACDLAALAIHDAHFADDPHYQARRRDLLLVAVNCSHPAATCFCVSTGDGPGASGGYDLLLDELDDGFLIRAGSATGEAILDGLHLADAEPARCTAAERQLEEAAASQQRTLPGRNLRDGLMSRLDHPRWSEVAGRCLSCGNCTSVCPTCFCHGHVETGAADGQSSDRYRVWDSCFTEGHSYIHGLVVRSDTRLRYRQWLTHKLATWHDQFGRSGCVGCGRCITWCPTGIDITEEAHALLDGGPA